MTTEEMKFEPGDVFAGMSPEDGIHVRRGRSAHGPTLEMYVRVGGELKKWGSHDSEFVVVAGGDDELDANRFDDSTFGLGECMRLQLFLEAMARFLNTGGDWLVAERAMRRMRAAFPYQLTLPGYRFLMTTLVVQPPNEVSEITAEHCFVRDTNEDVGVVWVEGMYIEPVRVSTYVHELGERRLEDGDDAQVTNTAQAVDSIRTDDPEAAAEVN